MKKYCLVILGTLALASCNKGQKFNVDGEIAGAEGKMLYLEASGLQGVEPLDSVKLSADGEFCFKHARPESPEFYRLRVGEKVINFSVDSTEVLKVKASYANFPTGYTIEGSSNCTKIKELTLMQIDLQKNVDALVKSAQKNKITQNVFEDSVAGMMNRYKNIVKTEYIYVGPNMTYAYFALFQKVNDYLLFDPMNDKEDIKCFQAVATSLTNAYPNADRSKNLYNMVIKGLKNTRVAQRRTIELPREKITEAGVIDISLKDLNGVTRKLSSLKGKVVLLDFTAYQSEGAVAHNFTLRELYNKYASKGLQIYQISLDENEHFWKTSADKLPWICVRDEDGSYSKTAAVYNVKKLPSYFLVNRNNELSARDESIKNLDEAVKRLL